MWKSPEADAAKCFKITNYSFGAVTSQSSEPSECKGLAAERRESSPVETSETSSTSASEPVRQKSKRMR